MKKLKAIDFFCGAGGMTYGLRKSGVDVLAGIDFDEKCRQTYIKNNPLSKFICADITKLEPMELGDKIGIQPDQKNLIFVGCTPCQYWTLLHTRKEKSKISKNLLHDYAEFVKFYRPYYLLLENVPGLASKKESPLSEFLTVLKEIGYHYSYKVVNIKNFNVPQSRKRFILIASRNSKIVIEEPKEVVLKTVKDYLGVHNGFKKISPGHQDSTSFNHSCMNLSSQNKKRLNLTPKDGGTRLAWSKCRELQIKAYENKDNYFTDVYGRLFWDKPAPTITTKFLSISNGRFTHPEEDRGLSIREGATLQSFPKSYNFIANSKGDISRMIGNAVPPKFAEFLGETIKIDYVSRRT